MHTNPHQLDRVFFALSDPTRREIVARLTRGAATVGTLAAPFPVSAPAISKHMKILERAGLVRRTVRGREHHCTLEADTLEHARSWLDFYRNFWNQRLDELESVLTDPADDPANHHEQGDVIELDPTD